MPDADADDGESTIEGEGVLQLGTDLGIDATTDLAILGFAQHCECEHMGTITRAEFQKGMAALGCEGPALHASRSVGLTLRATYSCDTLEALAKTLDNLRDGLRDKDRFASLYTFVYKFSREHGQKSLGIEMAAALLGLLLKGRFTLLDEFVEFLGVGGGWLWSQACATVSPNAVPQRQSHSMSLDTWQLILEFARTVNGDLDKYSEDGALRRQPAMGWPGG